eukprot:scaffold7328_cov314-Pinguiococcus_pyrenoidosus.AAC.14
MRARSSGSLSFCAWASRSSKAWPIASAPGEVCCSRIQGTFSSGFSVRSGMTSSGLGGDTGTPNLLDTAM